MEVVFIIQNSQTGYKIRQCLYFETNLNCPGYPEHKSKTLDFV